jgi:hypothetical protein
MGSRRAALVSPRLRHAILEPDGLVSDQPVLGLEGVVPLRRASTGRQLGAFANARASAEASLLGAGAIPLDAAVFRAIRPSDRTRHPCSATMARRIAA